MTVKIDADKVLHPSLGRRVDTSLRSLPPWLVFVVAFAGLLVHRASILSRPSFWDAAWSTSAGAAYLSRSGFDLLGLLRQPAFIEAGAGTHGSSLGTLVAGALQVFLDDKAGRVALHLLSVAVGAALAMAVYQLAAMFVVRRTAIFSAGVVVLLPLVLQQISDPYLDLPIGALTVATVVATVRQRPSHAAVLIFFAVWLKLSALALVPILWLAVPEGTRSEKLRRSTPFMVVAGLPGVLHVALARSVTDNTASPTLGGTLFLLKNAVVSLGSTLDVLVIFALFVVAARRLAASDQHRRLAVSAIVLTIGFFAIHVATIVVSQAITILPRYYLMVVPLWIVVVVVHFADRSPRSPLVFLGLLLAVSIINVNGDYYLNRDHPHPVMAERSLRAQEYLDMEIAGARALAETDVDLRLAGLHMYFRLMYPELGFVESTPPGVRLNRTLPDRLPDSFAWIVEPHETSADLAITQAAVEGGWTVTRHVVYEGVWRSELVVARR